VIECTDGDGDGYALEGGDCGPVDCNDEDPLVNPGAFEDCGNGIDDNCDGLTDEADPLCLVCTDSDGDGYALEGGDCGPVDCNDGDPLVNPGVDEDCGNGIDDNCDGLTDEADPLCLVCTDSDGDGYALEGGDCGPVDCNDGDPLVNPGAAEDCGNGIDDNCDGLTDEADPLCLVCTDGDGDGYALEGGDCGPVDCNDGDPLVNPGAAEDCGNGIDDNCDGLVDDEEFTCSRPNILVIGWDGAQRDHFWQCYNGELEGCENGLPNIAELSGGTIFNLTVTNGGTATKPGWAQILSGYDADVTGVYTNGVYQPIPIGYTLFEKIEDHFGSDNVTTIFISGKNVNTGAACVGDETTDMGQPTIEDQGQPWCLTKDYLDYYENDLRQNGVVATKAMELLEAHQNDFFFAFVLFREPDVIGHIAGEESLAYSTSLVEVDYWTGEIMEHIESLGIGGSTLLYVTTDHGFDEGLTRHGNAPYGFLASNDPLIVRDADRRDLAPTILERYGISRGALGSAPPIDGNSLYALPPFTCVAEGDAALDYDGAPVCCAGLTLISMDYPVGPSCLPATGGTGDTCGYCTQCGNGTCDLKENRCNCPVDCFR
jgi:hypothetical protein